MGDERGAVIKESRSRGIKRLRDLCASMETAIEGLERICHELLDVTTTFIVAQELDGDEADGDGGWQTG